ncbi:MAG: hypothetical protein IJS50_01195 [Desulfovibrio sp.]|nr:hypothetical protein [Desulfovibrio sp.]
MATLTFKNSQIIGCSITLGEVKHCIDEEPYYYENDPTLLKRLKNNIGFETRYTAKPQTTTADLCLNASLRLLKALNFDAKNLDAIISVTQTSDYIMPGNAHVLHKMLECPTTTATYDLNHGCSGFIQGLSLAYSLASSGLENILLVAGDTLSKKVDPNDRTLAPLFGDAGSAILIRHTDKTFPSFFLLGADGQGLEKMYIPAGGCRFPESQAAAQQKSNQLFMDGFGIFQFSMQRQPEAMTEILSFADKKLEAIDYFLFHQANRYIVRTISSKAGIPAKKVPDYIFSRYGNLNSASIPALLCADLASTLINEKSLVLMQGFGIGLSWGACITTLDHIVGLTPVCLGAANA